MNVFLNPAKDKWQEILQRPIADNSQIQQIVDEVIATVRKDGDRALRDYNAKFDNFHEDDFLVSSDEYSRIEDRVDASLKDAIAQARENITKFHAAQWEQTQRIETMPGVECWRKSVAIEKVGLYIPGGTAPLISTLLMLAVPAKIAGCIEIVVCSPARNGQLHPALLYTAKQLGVTKFFKLGGAQAIAAMAFGTESVPKVDKIFGPGNRFVMLAKQAVNSNGIAIDMPAGPSEVAVYADETCNPVFVAADLLSQAEHGKDSQVLLVTRSESLSQKVLAEIDIQKQALDRQEAVTSSLANSRCIVMENEKDCFELLNTYAPEHLIIASEDADRLSAYVINAGSVFLGNYSCESAGDYASGTNHTLPTNGFASAYSGVSLDSFIKKITFQKLSKEGLEGLSKIIVTLANAEGLTAHKNAVLKRID